MASSFRTALVREITDALRNTFDSSYPEEWLRGLFVGPDFQHEKSSYPMIYIVFRENFLRNVGLGHRISTDDTDSGENKEYLQWYFQGSLTFNCLALTTKGRDDLADNLLNILAFGRSNSYYKKFHDDIYDQDWILMYLMTEEIAPGGTNTMSAPWGGDDLLYHCNYTINMTGEFFSDPYNAEIIRISKIIPYPYRPDQSVPKGSQLPADINEPWQG